MQGHHRTTGPEEVYEGTYLASGFAPPKVPDALTALRVSSGSSGKGLNQKEFKHIKLHEVDGKTYAVIPNPQQVQVHLREAQLKRLREMIESHQIPAKRLKLTTVGINAPAVTSPLRATLGTLLESFRVVQDAAAIPGFKLLIMEFRAHPGVSIQFLQNNSGGRRTLETGTRIMSGGPGEHIDLKRDIDLAKLRGGAACFAWDLRTTSLFSQSSRPLVCQSRWFSGDDRKKHAWLVEPGASRFMGTMSRLRKCKVL